MEEEWKEIIDYSGYFISNFGNVKGIRFKDRLMKQNPNPKGYLHICMCNENERNKSFGIHRLVAKHFLEDFDENLYTDHIDRNKTNNHISNLRMVTNQINIRNQDKRQGLTSKYKGVCYDKSRNKWITKIKINYKSVWIGRYETEEEAGIAFNNYIIENNLEGFVLNEI